MIALAGVPGASTEAYIEQQMSAEWNAGWIARDTTAPPTGIVPLAEPDGQASGMIAPCSSIGQRIRSAMCARTFSMLSRSSSVSAEIASANAPLARRFR